MNKCTPPPGKIRRGRRAIEDAPVCENYPNRNYANYTYNSMGYRLLDTVNNCVTKKLSQGIPMTAFVTGYEKTDSIPY